MYFVFAEAWDASEIHSLNKTQVIWKLKRLNLSPVLSIFVGSSLSKHLGSYSISDTGSSFQHFPHIFFEGIQ
jgi:hypothetical protein